MGDKITTAPAVINGIAMSARDHAWSDSKIRDEVRRTFGLGQYAPSSSDAPNQTADDTVRSTVANDLSLLASIIQEELELARGCDGYEEQAVAEEIVKDHVAPALAERDTEIQRLRRKWLEAAEKRDELRADRDKLDDEALKWTEVAGRHAEEVEQLRAEVERLRNAPIGDLYREIDKLRAELEQARAFIGEMVLADMQPPLPPYGSKERAAIGGEQPDTEATEQASGSQFNAVVLGCPAHGMHPHNGHDCDDCVECTQGPVTPATPTEHACTSTYLDGAELCFVRGEHYAHRSPAGFVWSSNVSDQAVAKMSPDAQRLTRTLGRIVERPTTPTEPRVWRHGDEPPPLDVKKVRHSNSQVFTRVGPNGWRAGAGNVITGEQLVRGLHGYTLTEVVEDGAQ